MKGKLFIVSGPSGSGKSTITKLVRDKLNIPLAISVTTREKRKGEIESKDYYFISKEEFEKKIENDELFEYAIVHGNYYGTLNSEIERHLENGQNVILEIDVQGGIISKNKKNDSKLIFFKAPSLEILEERLRGRNTDSNETIEKRLKNAIKELEYEKYYDYSIINFNIEDSCNELINIIEGWENMKKNKISVDQLLKKVSNKYELAILAGKAARKEFLDGEEKYKIIEKVFKDILDEKVKIIYSE